MSADLRIEGTFKVGDRIAYNGDYIDEPPLGTITRVQKCGYRVAWDDGYKDARGASGVYPESDLVAAGVTQP